MPEGHTLHRLATQLRQRFAGRAVAVSSPQGRFAEGAALVDGRVLTRTEAHGKHLFLRFDSQQELHVHLGLYGTFVNGDGEPPPARGALRLRLTGEGGWADLRGPTACELLPPTAKREISARLGPDPLRRDARPEQFRARVTGSRAPVAALLMQQDVIAGVGNVFRAEALFRAGLDPYLPGRDLRAGAAEALWDDLRVLLRSGVRTGRIVTTRPEHRPRRGAPVRVDDAHYVYRRAGLPCRVCGTPVVSAELAARNLYWCPSCQAPGRQG